jgi:WD40 repeat protein
MRNWKLVSGALLALNVLAITLALLHRRPPDNQASVRILEGHRYSVQHLAFAPDGRTLATGGGLAHNAGEVKLWDLATGQERTTLSGHAAAVVAVAYSPDGQFLATASLDDIVRLWDLATGRERTGLPGSPFRAHSVAFTPEGRTLAGSGPDLVVRLWDWSTGRELARCRGWGAVTFAPDGQMLATAGHCGRDVQLWDTATLQERATLRGAEQVAVSMAYSPDGRLLAGASADETVHV